MKLAYTPTYSYITDYDEAFHAWMEVTFPSYLEEDEYKTFVKANAGLMIGQDTIYTIHRGAIVILSGYVKPIIYKWIDQLEITSNVKKYKCFDDTLPDFLYSHQKRIVNVSLNNNRGIIKSPTGSGKSFVIAALALKYYVDGLNILITVPTINLLHQLTKDIQDYCFIFGIEPPAIGKIGDGLYEPNKITIGIPQSLVKERCRMYLGTVDALLADEVHTCATPTYSMIVTCLTKTMIRLGLSATPWTNGGNHLFLNGFFGDLIIEIQESDMIDNDVILEPEFRFYPTPKAFLPAKLAQFAGQISDLKQGHRYKVLNQVYDYLISNNTGRNKLVVDLAVERIEEKETPIIVIVNKIRGADCHGAKIRNEFTARGYDLPIMGGHVSKKKQEKILNDLKENNIVGCIAGPKILSAGINIPSLSTIVLAGAGKSDSEFIQRVGRLLRKKKGKTRPVVIDFCDPQYWFVNQSRSRINIAGSVYGEHNVYIQG